MPRVLLGGRVLLLIMAAVTATWGSWALGAFLNRMAEQPPTAGDLVEHQLTGLIPASVVAATGAAWITAQMRRGGAYDMVLASNRPSWQLSLRPVLEAGAAVTTGWLVYWVVTTTRFAPNAEGAHLNVLALLMSLTSILLSCAIGHLIGVGGLGPVSIPAAAVVSYAMVLIATMADDTWVQGLFPSLGPSIDSDTPVLWFLAETTWLAGAALVLTWIASKRLASPQQTHRHMLVAAASMCVVGLAGIAALNVA